MREKKEKKERGNREKKERKNQQKKQARGERKNLKKKAIHPVEIPTPLCIQEPVHIRL